MNYRLDFELSEELELYRSAIEATIKPYIKIELTDNNNPNWWQSKFGGLPYMPKGFEYPKSNDGDYLYLLAQINFAEVPNLEGFPARGILQFYLAADEELYGRNFDNPSNQDKFRIIYFPQIDLNIDNLVTDFSFLPKLESEDWLMPFQGCCGLEFAIAYSPITLSDSRFNIFSEYSHRYDIPDYLYDNYYDLFCSSKKRLHFSKITQINKYSNLFQVKT